MLDAHRSLLALFASLAVVVIGCERDDTTVRAIQAQRQKRVQTQSKQDHLGEAFNLLQSYVDLNKDKARRQIAYHLNRWLDVRPVDAELSMPEMLRTIREIVPPERLADDFERTRFAPSDINHLRDCYLFRKVTEWVDSERSDDPLLADWLEAKAGTLSEEDATKLRTATRLFDWTVRNIAIEPKVMPENTAPPLPLPLPLGMKFRGAGYRQSDYHTLWRGTGDSLQRAGVFTHLCRQVSIPAFVLAIPVSQTGELKPWCVGVLIGEEVYLFEPELGMFVPGPSQVGIATLSQARSDASVMRRLSVPGFFDYPYSKQDVQQVTALLNVTPEWVAVRMKHLEQGLTGDRRLIAYADIEAEGEQIDAVAGIAGVRLWKVPLLNRVYTAVLEKAAQREVMFGFWYYSRWAIMDAPAPMSEELSRGRWRHLHGMFDSSEDGSIEGARTLYLAQRAPNSRSKNWISMSNCRRRMAFAANWESRNRTTSDNLSK